MQTIHINLQDEVYQDLQDSGVNIQSEIKEFLSYLTNDKYPTITTTEAKKRVKEAVEDYHINGDKNFSEFDEQYWAKLDGVIDRVQNN